MDSMGEGIAIGVVATLVAVCLFAVLRAGGIGGLGFGLTVAGRSARDAAFAEKVRALLAGAPLAPLRPAEPPPPPKLSGVPLRMLALLQAESRLVDFLMEDVQAFNDQQIGQAVREVHKNARAALLQHATPRPILPGTEGDAVTVPVGFDPSAIRVVGNVVGNPPFTGAIQHPGWRVNELKLSAPPAGADEFVLQPAEVQVP